MENRTSNEELARRIDAVERNNQRRFREMKASINDLRLEMVDKLQPYHDYMIAEEAIKKAGKKNGNNLSIGPDLIRLAIILATIIAALVGANAISK